MRGTANCTIVGNLVADPVIKDINGTALAEFAVAVNEQWKDAKGETQEYVNYFDVQAWGPQAGPIGQYLAKGRAVLVLGNLRQDKWQAQDGTNRSKVIVRSQSVQFLGSPQGNGNSANVAPADTQGDVEAQMGF